MTTCLECAENTNVSEVKWAITWLRIICFDLSWKDYAWSRLFERYENSDRGVYRLRLGWLSERLPSEHLRHLSNRNVDWLNQSIYSYLESSWNVSEQPPMYTVWWNISDASFDPGTYGEIMWPYISSLRPARAWLYSKGPWDERDRIFLRYCFSN